MKKLFFISVVFFGLATAADAQATIETLKSEIKADKKVGDKADARIARKELRKLEGNEVSYNSTKAFEEMYPHIKLVSTERLKNYDEFDFMKDGHQIAAFFDENASLVATTQKISYKDLPQKAKGYIAKKYPGYIPVTVLYLDNNEKNPTDMILYNNTQLEPVDSYVVELSNGLKAIALQIEINGSVHYFARVL
ncbi:MAG: hypothetical protein ABIN48_00865 [Ginsengibacter sp.]